MDTRDPHASEPLPAVDGPLALVLTGDDEGLRAIDFDFDAADELHAAAGDPLFGGAIAAGPRPNPARGAHPARVVMHASARLFRFDDRSPDLGMEYLVALDASLDQGLDAWAGIAAREWVNFRQHTGDLDGTFHAVERILLRHPVESLSPRVASPLAQLAARVGEAQVAAELWNHARGHDDLRSSARASWLVEQEWAQGYLMLLAGEPARAAHTLRRVHAGLEPWQDPPARLRLLETALELGFALVLAGRCAEAVEALDHSLETFAGEGEFVAWIHGMRALALALLLNVDGANDALERAAAAASDTTTLELNACIPARMVLDAIAGARSALVERVAAARRITRERSLDVEQRVVWRLFAVLALLAGGVRSEAIAVARELEDELERSPLPLPLYRDHAELLVGLVDRNLDLEANARLRLDRRAVVLHGDAGDVWGVIGRADAMRSGAEDRPLRLAVLDGLSVDVGGDPVDARSWSGRRKSRIVLALLVAAGGRMERDTFLDELWPADRGSSAAGARLLATVLSTARSTLAAAGAELPVDAPEGHRALRTRGHMIELVLGPHDTTDVGDLRALVQEVVASDPRDAEGLERLAVRLLPLATGVPLRDLGSEPIIQAWRERLARELGDACAALLGRWIVASSSERPVPTTGLLALARAAHRIDPFDEQAVGHLVELLGWSGRVAEASRTFHEFRDRIDELGLQPSVELVRRHAAIID